MIITRLDGKLVEINKYDFSNDVIYYEKIMNIKKGFIAKKASSNFLNEGQKIGESNTKALISNFLHIPIHL
uniref:Uncharacterized protein n=1 Tax=viral metagenome TaxID=1070528 RepID=A0A6C0DJV5_9ZZZZ